MHQGYNNSSDSGTIELHNWYSICMKNPRNPLFRPCQSPTQKIDVAAVHLSINSLRERYIDFTVPFMDAGLLVVVKGETHANSNTFFFLSPFSAEVW